MPGYGAETGSRIRFFAGSSAVSQAVSSVFVCVWRDEQCGCQAQREARQVPALVFVGSDDGWFIFLACSPPSSPSSTSSNVLFSSTAPFIVLSFF